MTPAPQILSAPAVSTAPVTPAAGSAPVLAPGGPPFDAILLLEELAASLVPIHSTGIDAGAAELGSGLLESSDDLDSEDSVEETEEDDELLAFLAGMIAAAPPASSQGQAQAPEAELAGEGGDDAITGGEAQPRHHSKIADRALPLVALDTTDSAPAPNANQGPIASPGTAVRADAETAARAFSAFLSTPNTRAAEEPGTPTRALDFITQAPRTPSAPAIDQTSMTRHVRDPRWAEEFGTRIVTMVNQRESVASISLLPVDLGPVDVNVTVKDSQATIHFGAAQADTRALIEASLPKLRELLAAQGFQLLDASVSQGFTRQSRPESPSVPRTSSIEEATPAKVTASRAVGLLDTYA